MKFMTESLLIAYTGYDCEELLRDSLKNIPQDIKCDLIYVDEGSVDSSVKIAENYNARVIILKCRGHGRAQKTAIRYALKKGYTKMILTHPHFPDDVKFVNRLISHDNGDVVFGSRMRTGKAVLHGMPVWKYLGNIFISKLFLLFTGIDVHSLHSGFRLLTRKAMKNLQFKLMGNGYIFDVQMVLQFAERKIVVSEVPLPTHQSSLAPGENWLVRLTFLSETVLEISSYAIRRLFKIK